MDGERKFGTRLQRPETRWSRHRKEVQELELPVATEDATMKLRKIWMKLLLPGGEKPETFRIWTIYLKSATRRASEYEKASSSSCRSTCIPLVDVAHFLMVFDSLYSYIDEEGAIPSSRSSRASSAGEEGGDRHFYVDQIVGMKEFELTTLYVDFSHLSGSEAVLARAIADQYYR